MLLASVESDGIDTFRCILTLALCSKVGCEGQSADALPVKAGTVKCLKEEVQVALVNKKSRFATFAEPYSKQHLFPRLLNGLYMHLVAHKDLKTFDHQ